MSLNVKKYWETSTQPPPQNQIIGKYHVKGEIHRPTNYSYIYLSSNVNNKAEKVLKFVKCKRNETNKILNEVEIMKILKHPNILELDDYFLFKEYMCIVTQFLPLSSLHDLIIDHYNQGIPEDMASKIMYQLLDALNYLHKNNICHRDIKTENILMVDSDPKHPIVKLSDFGSAGYLAKDSKSNEFIGTYNFSAPEILQHIKYTKKVDIWSLGITLYVMLTGMLPFPSYSYSPIDCKYMIINGCLNYELLYDFGISNDAIDLIMKMCKVDPNLRITAEEAMKHPWIVSQRSNKNEAYTSESQIVEYYISK